MCHADDLSAMAQTMIDNAAGTSYGQPVPVHIIYESMFKPQAHRDAVRYIEKLLAQLVRFPVAPDSSTLSPSTQEGTI